MIEKVLCTSSLIAVLCCYLNGCADDGCVPGDMRSCPCLDGNDGERVCADDGLSWNECKCAGEFGDLTVFEGSYTIENSIDADRLASIVELTGTLTIAAPGLASLSLPNLKKIGRDLIITGCNALQHLDGLAGLNEIGRNFHIIDSDALLQIDGLSALTRVGGNLFFYKNDALKNVDGLLNLTELGGFLHIYTNSALESLEGFTGLTSVGESIHTWDNDFLHNLDGYRNIKEIGGGLCFSNDDLLEDVSGLAGIEHVKGDFHIFLNHELVSLHGLHNIHTIDRHVYIGFMQNNVQFGTVALKDLDGLASLEKVGGNLNIAFNEALVDVEGLSELKEVGGYLILYDNPLLPTCQLEELVERLEKNGWDGSLRLENNLDDECADRGGAAQAMFSWAPLNRGGEGIW